MYGDGTQTRDFIYVKDIVGALTFVAEHPEVTGVFNAGYGGQITIEELADNIIKAAGSSSKVLHAPERAGDVKHSRACADKLRSAGWRPNTPCRKAWRLRWNISRASWASNFPEPPGSSSFRDCLRSCGGDSLFSCRNGSCMTNSADAII